MNTRHSVNNSWMLVSVPFVQNCSPGKWRIRVMCVVISRKQSDSAAVDEKKKVNNWQRVNSSCNFVRCLLVITAGELWGGNYRERSTGNTRGKRGIGLRLEGAFNRDDRSTELSGYVPASQIGRKRIICHSLIHRDILMVFEAHSRPSNEIAALAQIWWAE